MDPASLVYDIDIFLLFVIIVFALFNAPRAIARFARRSEWLQGHLLHSATLTRKPRINLNTNSIYLHSDPQKPVLDLDGGATEAIYSQSNPYFPSESSLHEKALPPRPLTIVVPPSQQAWHMPMLSSLVHPLATLLHTRVHENYSLGQVLLMAGYSVIILYAGLYKSNPFVDFNRSGWVSTSQLPFIYILATKNNVIGMLIDVGYEKVCVSGDVTWNEIPDLSIQLNYLHRIAGSVAILAANVHAIGYSASLVFQSSFPYEVFDCLFLAVYEWSIAGNLSEHISEPSIMWALVALVCSDILGIFSMQFVRSRSYNLFLVTHIVALIVLLFSVSVFLAFGTAMCPFCLC